MSTAEPLPERHGTGQAAGAVRYATIPLRDKAQVARRDALRERAEAALRKHRRHRRLPAR